MRNSTIIETLHHATFRFSIPVHQVQAYNLNVSYALQLAMYPEGNFNCASWSDATVKKMLKQAKNSLK
jgi:hypothetical protein